MKTHVDFEGMIWTDAAFVGYPRKSYLTFFTFEALSDGVLPTMIQRKVNGWAAFLCNGV